MIQATLTLDLLTLSSIKFSTAQVILEIEGKIRRVEFKNEGKKLGIIIDGSHVDVNFPILDDEERAVYLKNGRLDDYLEEQRLRLIADAGVQIQNFLKFPRPLFLGLERKAGRYDDEVAYFDDDPEEHIYRPSARRLQRSIVEGLENCQRLIAKSYQKYRVVSDGSSKRLIKVIVESAFDYIELSSETFSSPAGSVDFQNLIGRRSELEAIAKNLGGGVKAETQINNLFLKITEVIDEKSNDANKRSIELLLNKVQIQRIQNLLVEMDRQKKAAEHHYAPISEFLNSLNLFFKESGKIAAVDSLGRLSVTQGGHPINLTWLSSGEKQLIILLAHARFARNKGGVIIVDEPELSLHLKWQEMLIECISPPNSSIQFIFATHSPEIVGYKKQNCIAVGLDA